MAKALLEDDGAAAGAPQRSGCRKVDDLLAQLGYGKVAARQVLDALVPEGRAEGEGARTTRWCRR